MSNAGVRFGGVAPAHPHRASASLTADGFCTSAPQRWPLAQSRTTHLSRSDAGQWSASVS